jgi:beta-lactamase superfamily II metal-dependent hydrolase
MIAKYKEKAKKYHDRKQNVKRSHIKLGDKVLMKDRRTDRLKPEVGTVVCINDYSVTVRFRNGKTFNRNKSQ